MHPNCQKILFCSLIWSMSLISIVLATGPYPIFTLQDRYGRDCTCTCLYCKPECEPFNDTDEVTFPQSTTSENRENMFVLRGSDGNDCTCYCQGCVPNCEQITTTTEGVTTSQHEKESTTVTENTAAVTEAHTTPSTSRPCKYLEPEDCPPGYTYFENVQRCYWVNQAVQQWNNSREECAQSGGDLAKILNEQQSIAIMSLLDSINDTASAPLYLLCPTGYWLGGARCSDTCHGHFMWKYMQKPDEPIIYANWDTGKPNCKEGSESCLQFYYSPFENRRLGKWSDRRCSAWYCGVCEYRKNNIALL